MQRRTVFGLFVREISQQKCKIGSLRHPHTTRAVLAPRLCIELVTGRRHFLASDGMTTNSEVQIVGGDYRAKLGELRLDQNGELVFIDVVAEGDLHPEGRHSASCAAPEDAGIDRPLVQAGFLAALAVDADGSGGHLRRVAALRRYRDIRSGHVRRVLLQRPRRPGSPSARGHNRGEAVLRTDGKCDARGRVGGSKVLGRPDMDARYVQAGPDTPTGSENDESNANASSSAHFSPSTRMRPSPALCFASSRRLASWKRVHGEGGRRGCGGGGWRRVDQQRYRWSPTRRHDVLRRLAATKGRGVRLRRGERIVAKRAGVCSDARRRRGVPDGMCVDEGGGVWVCVWDAGKVFVTCRTARGTLGWIGRSRSRVQRPTSCCFGGESIDPDRRCS